MSDPKPNPVEAAVDCDAKSSQIQLANDDTSGGRLQYSETHKFWETQPVEQFKDIGDTSLPQGPIEPATPLSEVREEPYNLLAEFEWTDCDMNSDDMCSKVYNFIEGNYLDEECKFKVHYSKEFLKWALCPPGYNQNLNIGVCVKTSKKLVAFVSGVPRRIRVRDEVVRMANINFLCIHKKLRAKGLDWVMLKEATRRVHLQNIRQAAYASHDILSKPVTTRQNWGRRRMLNPKKLIDLGYAKLRERMTMRMALKLYKLPEAPITPGFREMELRDVPAVTGLLRNYLSQFGVATDFDENDVHHWLLPRKDVVHSYLVVNPETYDVTDFCSFYSLPFTISGNPKYTTLECAYSYYNVVTQTSLPKLMNDVLIVAKQKGFDVFYALEMMINENFVEELKFCPGIDTLLHYYVYNYRLGSALKPSRLGLLPC